MAVARDAWRRRTSRLERIAYPALALAAGLLLLVRLAPDVTRKPLHEDEALAALVSARPLGELLATVLWDRGGAPLHFVLSHAAIAVSPSMTAVRLVSVALALGAVAACWELGRRLDGPATGAAAALLAGTSQMLAIYGSVGRMYALLACASAVAAILFVRAVQRPTAGTAAAAAAAALLLPASHPYGGIVVAAEACVALALWRGRPLRPALPTLALCLGFLPFLAADLRLANRFSLSAGGGNSIASPDTAARLVGRAVGSFAGGREPVVALFLVLAAIGVWRLVRSQPAFVAFAGLALAGVVTAMLLGKAGGGLESHLATRHLVFALPFWVVLVGCGATRVVVSWSPAARVGALVVLGVVALAAPQAVPDPRTRASGLGASLAEPRPWLQEHAVPGVVLFPASPVFAGSLATTRHGHAVPREQPDVTLPAVRRAALPAPAVLVAIPLDGAELAGPVPPGARLTPHWLLLREPGPFGSDAEVLHALEHALATASAALPDPPLALRGYLRQASASVCGSLRRLGERCDG